MLEHQWGKEAFERFPELIDQFDQVESPYQLWIELMDAFRKAYETPRNEDLISRIYAYADWCCTQPEGATAEDDLGSCVCVCFYEDIPTIPAALEDMPRWFTRDEIVMMKQTFSYMVGEEGFQRLLRAYDVRREGRKKARH